MARSDPSLEERYANLVIEDEEDKRIIIENTKVVEASIRVGRRILD